MNAKPKIGVLLGDSSGIGPEQVAKTSANSFLTEICSPIIIGDIRVFRHALKRIEADVPHYKISSVTEADRQNMIPVLDLNNQCPQTIEMGKISAYCGSASCDMIRAACALCKSGEIDGFVYAPLNKAAMIEGGMGFKDEQHFMADIFGTEGSFGEINQIGNLMTSRVTSHIPLSQVSRALTVEGVLSAIELLHATTKNIGIASPHVGVAAFNPHGGENGLCGREEIDVLLPAIEQAAKKGINATGPYPADTVFVRAFQGDFDGVVTLYHDQGQIAIKVKGFDDGVTIAGGLPYPIATPAHGTAFDIADRLIAKTAAFEFATRTVVKMARHRH